MSVPANNAVQQQQSHIKKNKKSLISFRTTRDNFMVQQKPDSANQQQILNAGQGASHQIPQGHTASNSSQFMQDFMGVGSGATHNLIGQKNANNQGLMSSTGSGQIHYNSNPAAAAHHQQQSNTHMSQLSMVSGGNGGVSGGPSSATNRQSATGRRGQQQYKMSNQQSQLQLSQPNLMTYQQIDTGVPATTSMAQNYHSQPPTAGPLTNTNNNQNKRNFSNSGRINFGQNNQLGTTQNKPKFKQMLSSQGSGDVMITAPQTMMHQQQQQQQQHMNLTSSRFKNINDRIKKSNRNNRRIQISFDNAQKDLASADGHHGQQHQQVIGPNGQFISGTHDSTSGLDQQQKQHIVSSNAANRITSTERFQNNNVSSAHPNKAIVTPRQNQLKSFKGGTGMVVGAAATEQDVMTALQQHQQQISEGASGNQLIQKNIGHQIQTQRNNYNPQIIYGGVNSSSQFSVKNSNQNAHNLPLIRNESLELQVKDHGTQRYGNFMQTQQVQLGSNQGVRGSFNQKISQSQGAGQGNPSGLAQGHNQQNSGQNSMRMSFTKFGGQKTAQGIKDQKQQMNLVGGTGMVNQVNSAMLIQQNSQSSPQISKVKGIGTNQVQLQNHNTQQSQQHIQNQQHSSFSQGHASSATQQQKMLYVKKNAKNQMLIYNKNNNKQVGGAQNLQNQASSSMLSALPTGTASNSGVMGNNSNAISNNFVKSSQGQQSNAIGPGGSSLAQITNGSQQMQRSVDMSAAKSGSNVRKRQGSNHKLPPHNQGSNFASTGGAQQQQDSVGGSGQLISNQQVSSSQLNIPVNSRTVNMMNSVIPEASERDELTVNETSNMKIEFPITPQQAKAENISEKYLTDFEKTEIEEYDQIYYLCENEFKIKASNMQRLVNNGFDDEEGYYRIQKGDHIAFRFQLIEVIGKGAFGQVIKCLDHKHKELVAIKLVKNQKKYYYQAAVEAKLLLLLKESDPDNVERVVKLRDYFVFRNHLCCVFDLFSINLYEFIKMYNYQGFEYGLIRRFAIQLLSALRYMKYLGIIHCDLKPENILLKRKDKSGIVVADFGSGCLENEIVYTYIQSRFYRAPDIILGLFPYTQQIDMWSFGCIMIELYTGFPLFPGTNEKEQLQLIIDVIGMPSQQVLKNSQRKQLFSQFKDNAVPAPLEVLTNDQKEERLRYIMNKLRDMPDQSFVNFIGRCLEWDPNKRLTPDEGLQHEWIIKGLPPNIILHNPHNNPYARKNNNSSNSTSKGYKTAQIQQNNAQKSAQQIQIKRQQSANRRSRKTEIGSQNTASGATNAIQMNSSSNRRYAFKDTNAGTSQRNSDNDQQQASHGGTNAPNGAVLSSHNLELTQRQSSRENAAAASGSSTAHMQPTSERRQQTRGGIVSMSGAAQASMGSSQQHAVLTSNQNQAKNSQRMDSRSIKRKIPKQKMQLDSSTMMAGNNSNDFNQPDHLSQGAAGSQPQVATDNSPTKQSDLSQSQRNNQNFYGTQRMAGGVAATSGAQQDDKNIGILASKNMSANSSQKQSINAIFQC